MQESRNQSEAETQEEPLMSRPVPGPAHTHTHAHTHTRAHARTHIKKNSLLDSFKACDQKHLWTRVWLKGTFFYIYLHL